MSLASGRLDRKPVVTWAQKRGPPPECGAVPSEPDRPKSLSRRQRQVIALLPQFDLGKGAHRRDSTCLRPSAFTTECLEQATH